MIFFAIREIGTDNFIPARKKVASTSEEALSIFSRPPRLWHKEHSAQSWLTLYCKGPLMQEWEISGSGPDEKTISRRKHYTKDARDRARFAIVRVELTIGTSP